MKSITKIGWNLFYIAYIPQWCSLMFQCRPSSWPNIESPVCSHCLSIGLSDNYQCQLSVHSWNISFGPTNIYSNTLDRRMCMESVHREYFSVIQKAAFSNTLYPMNNTQSVHREYSSNMLAIFTNNPDHLVNNNKCNEMKQTLATYLHPASSQRTLNSWFVTRL